MLFNNENLTPAKKKKQLINAISETALASLIVVVKTGYDAIWNSSDSTPLEVLTEFGIDANSLFDASSATQQFIKTLKPDYIFLIPPYNVAFNDDGSVKEITAKGNEDDKS